MILALVGRGKSIKIAATARKKKRPTLRKGRGSSKQSFSQERAVRETFSEHQHPSPFRLRPHRLKSSSSRSPSPTLGRRRRLILTLGRLKVATQPSSGSRRRPLRISLLNRPKKISAPRNNIVPKAMLVFKLPLSAGVAQLVEHPTCNRAVEGSSPFSSIFGGVA